MPEIGGYRIGRLLGQGSFGETYEATKEGERVALKLIREEALLCGFDIRRFQREVRALQKAVGPNVVRFIDAGVGQLGNEIRYYVALEYLEGKDLARTFHDAGSSFDERYLKEILSGIVAGLKTVHSQNIVHRDLKPANVFVTDAGNVKLLDFGLVKMLDYTTLTILPGQPIGTPLYIAPEILRGDEVDQRADFYSLGVLIYHLATRGNYPFSANIPLELYARVVNNAPIPPTRHNRSLSCDFENLILTLLSKQPYQRTFDHDELIQAIQSTPVNIPTTPNVSNRPSQTAYRKHCFIRLLNNEKGEIERFIRDGGAVDGIEYPANFLPRYKNSLNVYGEMGLRYLFDPVTYRLAYSSFAQTQGLVNLPYVPNPHSVLVPSDLQTLESQQTYARGCIDWQLHWGCSILVAPFHFCRDLESPWMDIDIKLIEESIAYARSVADGPPVYAGLCLNMEAYTIEANRLALLNRYSRVRAEGYMFYVDNLDERTNNPLQVRAFLDLLTLFQRLGRPVLACRVGTLGLGLLAAGIDGITNGIASLTSFSENNLLVNRAINYDMERKYYIPSMMLTLSVPMAEDILSDSRNPALRCDCPYCRNASGNLGNITKVHFLHVRTHEIAELNALPNTPSRMTWFAQRVAAAIQACNNVRAQRTVALSTGHYLHLRVWQQVFSPAAGGTP